MDADAATIMTMQLNGSSLTNNNKDGTAATGLNIDLDREDANKTERK